MLKIKMNNCRNILEDLTSYTNLENTSTIRYLIRTNRKQLYVFTIQSFRMKTGLCTFQDTCV